MLGALIMLAGCEASRPNPATPESSGGLTRQDFDQYLVALEMHDFDTVRGFYSPDVKLYVQAAPGEPLAPSTVEETFALEGFFAEHWDWKFNLHQVTVGPDSAAVHATMTGPVIKDFPDLPDSPGPKAGEMFTINFISLYKTVGGKITELRVFSASET